MWSTTENAPLSINQTKNEKQIFYEKLEHLIWIYKNKSSLVAAAGDMNVNLAKFEKEIR